MLDVVEDDDGHPLPIVRDTMPSGSTAVTGGLFRVPGAGFLDDLPDRPQAPYRPSVRRGSTGVSGQVSRTHAWSGWSEISHRRPGAGPAMTLSW